MLSRRIVRLGRKLIPRFVLDAIYPFEPFMKKHVEEFCRRLPKGAKVLDAGAGEAQYKPVFDSAGHRYFGIDLGVGEPDWSYQGITAFARVEHIPFRERLFDGVMSNAVLEHTPAPRHTLHEMNRALKPGGLMLIVVPTMWEEHMVPYDYYRFTRWGMENLLKETGFELIEMKPIGGYFWFMGRKFIDILEFFQSFPRLLLWPLLVVPFGFVLPAIFNALDWLDRDKFYTIGQLCFARKVSEEDRNGSGVLP